MSGGNGSGKGTQSPRTITALRDRIERNRKARLTASTAVNLADLYPLIEELDSLREEVTELRRIINKLLRALHSAPRE